MRIVSLEKAEKGGTARVSATMIWEDNDRPNEPIYFETSADGRAVDGTYREAWSPGLDVGLPVAG